MINSNLIRDIVEKGIAGTGIFLVDILVKPTCSIYVFIDGETGVSVEDCAKISRLIENNLNRDEADFELQVSSPGITQPFKVIKQYKKNIGNDIDIVFTDGSKQRGMLEQVQEEKIEISWKSKESIKNIAGTKDKQLITKKMIDLKNIKTIKIIKTHIDLKFYMVQYKSSLT